MARLFRSKQEYIKSSDKPSSLEADIRNTFGLWLRNTPQGSIMLDWLETVASARVYEPGEDDLSAVAFREGYRFLAMEILDMSMQGEAK